MTVFIANAVVLAAGAYALVGVVFGVFFAWRGAAAVDHAAASAGFGFRVLVIPGAALLWPWLARKWARGDSGLPELAPVRALRRRHLPMWVVLGPLAMIGLAFAVAARSASVGGLP